MISSPFYCIILIIVKQVNKESRSKAAHLTLALSPQGRGDFRIAPPLRGGDKGEGV
jgi:hypothetical protein